MKRLFSRLAERAALMFSALAAAIGETFGRSRFFTEIKRHFVSFWKRIAASSLWKGAARSLANAGDAVLRFFRKSVSFIVEYRLFAACAVVLLLGAVVVISVVGGKSAGTSAGSGNIGGSSYAETIKSSDMPTALIYTDPTPEPTVPLEPDWPEPTVKVDTSRPTTAPVQILVDNGTHNELIPDVQQRLMDLWYMDEDEPTDYFGEITTNAIMAFQRRSGLDMTGKLDERTYNMLMADDAKVYMSVLGDEGSDVENVQLRLYELGFLESVTGTFDEATYDAVLEFQTKNGLGVDGKVGRLTKEKLYDPDARGKEYARGSTGDEVLKYQLRLQKLGYLTTEPDGVYGSDTEIAVRRFQEQNSLIANGYLGPTTREVLMSVTAKGNALSYGMNGSDVQNVQLRLYQLNYLRAKDVNSYYTSITEDAVKLFQKNNGLSVDGKVGKYTMAKLFADDAVRAQKPVSNSTAGSGSSGGSSGNNSGGSTGGGNSGGGSSGGNSGGSTGGSASSRIENFINVARSKLGCRYVRGGKGPNTFDCSGFVYWCLNHSGISQGYMTSYMWRSCTRYQRNTNINDVRRGDVIVYKGHVAIALGNWRMIDASNSNGKVVERGFNSSYWHRNFICSYRIFR